MSKEPKFSVGDIVRAEDDRYLFREATIYAIDKVTKDEPPLYLVRGNATRKVLDGGTTRYHASAFWEHELKKD